MPEPYRSPFGEEVKISDQSLLQAVQAGSFELAEFIFERLPRELRKIPSLRRDLPTHLLGRVVVAWRPTMGDRLMSLFAGEGAKGPWRLELDGKAVVVGFDHFVVVSPLVTDKEVALLRGARLID